MWRMGKKKRDKKQEVEDVGREKPRENEGFAEGCGEEESTEDGGEGSECNADDFLLIDAGLWSEKLTDKERDRVVHRLAYNRADITKNLSKDKKDKPFPYYPQDAKSANRREKREEVVLFTARA